MMMMVVAMVSATIILYDPPSDDIWVWQDLSEDLNVQNIAMDEVSVE